ncbi:response regulator [Halobacteriovorax sp. GB3]|uniref:response regulator n=1 Tax=Halobacteriovorax sp. GB3 TaxID=2719615 RepID=UPI00235F81BE|nr:response regulator [Halobacteriovorax sp. GB3]MDD0853017.1 response regulator [Halobacteriovorax sp. GB3]
MKTILLVDDEAFIRKLMREEIEERFKVNIKEFDCLKKALLYSKNKRPDLIITDYKFENSDLLDAIEHNGKPDCEMVLFTAMGISDVKIKEIGFSFTATKPSFHKMITFLGTVCTSHQKLCS